MWARPLKGVFVREAPTAATGPSHTHTADRSRVAMHQPCGRSGKPRSYQPPATSLLHMHDSRAQPPPQRGRATLRRPVRPARSRTPLPRRGRRPPTPRRPRGVGSLPTPSGAVRRLAWQAPHLVAFDRTGCPSSGGPEPCLQNRHSPPHRPEHGNIPYCGRVRAQRCSQPGSQRVSATIPNLGQGQGRLLHRRRSHCPKSKQ